jgi:tRNA pseudouridine38-40 synthase
VRIRLDLAYDGSGFAGWASQPGLRTVQGDLQAALAVVLRLPDQPRLVVAGRTDAGVHARGQVAHVDLPVEAWSAVPGRSAREPGRALVDRLSAVLGADVVVHRAAPAPAEFDARFAALWRRYAYRIADDVTQRDPLHRTDILWHRRALDVAAMAAAADRLLGEHDFAAFCRPRDGATTIRELQSFSWGRTPAGTTVAAVRADAFCHSMVRALVGACLAVGEGRRPVEWPAQVLAGGRRDPAVAVAPACGLTLEEVAYPADHELAARVAAARRVRTLPPKGVPHPS